MSVTRGTKLALAFVGLALLWQSGCCSPRLRHAPSGMPERESLDIPESVRNRPNPVRDLGSSIASGEKYFQSLCSPCHGKKGNGKGKLAREMGLNPPNFRCACDQESRTDGELFHILTEGHGDMPGQGDRWDDRTKWDLINYIRSLKRWK